MEKPIIATTVSGLFISNEPWKIAHKLGMEELAKLSGDDSVLKATDSPDYFKKVESALEKIYPNLTPTERVIKRREIYFGRVLDLIKKNPQFVNKEAIKYFSTHKQNYRIALITTNTKYFLEKVFAQMGINLFDVIETSLPEEKDNKRLVFERFLKKYGKPKVYVGGSKSDSYDFCKENNVPCIYANFYGDKDISGVQMAKNLEELEKLLGKIL